jgi:hypothetical protein
MRFGTLIAWTVFALLAAAAPATAAPVHLTGGTRVAPTSKLPPLDLTDAQRGKIRDGLRGVNSQVEFHLKATKKAKDFAPQVGAKLPKGVKPTGLPSSVTQAIPQLADYGYAKMKGDVLIVNEMTGKIAAIVPMPPQTAGQ